MNQWHDNPHFTRQDKQEIGDKIRLYRESLGLTQEGLSAKTGIDAKVISRNEQGSIRDIESLIKYVIAFDCTLSDLLPDRVLLAMNDCKKQDLEIQKLLKRLSVSRKEAILGLLRQLLLESA